MNKDLIFPNNLYIFNKNGEQIDPKSKEGKEIIKTFKLQEQIKKDNEEQNMKWIMSTFPNDKELQEKYKKKFGLS